MKHTFGTTVFRVVTARKITTGECDWLNQDIPSGTLLEVRSDPYNVVSESGVPVGFAHEEKYFEIPLDSVIPIDENSSVGM